jgi:hypothetical protein
MRLVLAGVGLAVAVGVSPALAGGASACGTCTAAKPVSHFKQVDGSGNRISIMSKSGPIDPAQVAAAQIGGTRNSIKIKQDGTGNVASALQIDGDKNRIKIHQKGNDNTATAVQLGGSGQKATIRQRMP